MPDDAAKKALQKSRLNYINKHIPIPFSAVKHTLNHNVTLLAQYDYYHTSSESISTQRYNKLHPLRYELPPTTILFHHAKPITRAILHHLIFLPHVHPHRHTTPICTRCTLHTPETTQHIILDCPAHDTIRTPLLVALQTESLTNSIDPTQAIPDLIEALTLTTSTTLQPLMTLHTLTLHPQIVHRILPAKIKPTPHKPITDHTHVIQPLPPPKERRCTPSNLTQAHHQKQKSKQHTPMKPQLSLPGIKSFKTRYGGKIKLQNKAKNHKQPPSMDHHTMLNHLTNKPRRHRHQNDSPNTTKMTALTGCIYIHVPHPTETHHHAEPSG